MDATEAPAAGATFVRFALGDELYVLPVDAVLEVADLPDVAPVPGAPGAVLGVCTRRGNVLPVLDVRPLLGVSEAAPIGGRLVVTERAGRTLGLAVDLVTDVGPLPGTAEPTDVRHLSGAVMVDHSLVGILDLDSLMAAVEVRG